MLLVAVRSLLHAWATWKGQERGMLLEVEQEGRIRECALKNVAQCLSWWQLLQLALAFQRWVDSK